MKVVYVTMQFPADTETFASNDVLMLKNLNIDISVFSLKSKHKKQEKMIYERGLKDIYIFNCTFLNILLGVFLLLTSPFKALDLTRWVFINERGNIKELIKCFLLIPSSITLYRKIVKIRPDVIHLFWGHYPSIVGYLINKHNPNILLSTFLGAYDLNLNLNISKFVAQRSDFVFTHSYSNIQSLLKMNIPRRNIEVVHRSVDVKKIDDAVLGIQTIEGRIITAGKLIPEKKVDLIIVFLKKITDAGGNFYLDVVGSGPELLKLKLLSKEMLLDERINFYSHMSQYELFRKMAAAQFFIMTSSKKSERLPNVIKEAMYCSCVCASFRTQGIDELIKTNVNGFIFDSIDKQLEDLFLLSTRPQLDEIALNAKRTISNDFQLKHAMLLYKNKWKKGLSNVNKI